MQKITMNGTSYIGKLEEVDGKITIKKGMVVSSNLTKKELMMYTAEKQAQRLQDITFSGTGIAYSVTPFTDLEKLWVKTLKDTMKYARKNTVNGTTNEIFFKVLEK